MSKLRIAVWHNLPSGGGKRALYEHVRGLKARGHHLVAWRPPTADAAYLPLTDLIQEHVVSLDPTPRRFGGRKGWLLNDYYRAADLLAACDKHAEACAAQIAAQNFDLLFLNSCRFTFAPAIGRYVQIPKVIYLGEPARWLYEAQPELPWLAPPQQNGAAGGWKRLWRRLPDVFKVHGLREQARHEVENARACDRILVNSFYSRESVLRAYGLDSKVCYLGIDLERFQDRGLPREDLVVGLGSIGAHKNVHWVVAAIAKIAPPRPRLVWIGNAMDAGYGERVRADAARLGVSLEMFVNVPEALMLDVLNRARVMAYAPRLEPFGLAPLEANACGTPVVAMREGGVRETIESGQNGLLVDPDLESFAAGLEGLLRDPERAERLRRSSRRLVEEKWSMESAIDRIERNFMEVAAGTGQPA